MNTSEEMTSLLNSINNIRYQSNDTFDQIFKSSNSTLGKFYQLFLLLKDNKNIFDGLIEIYPMNFIQFMEQIDIKAKQNRITKEYLYQKVSLLKIIFCFNYKFSQLFQRTFYLKYRNKNNNAVDPLIEYNNDLSRLKKYFNKNSDQSKYPQMTCSKFVKCIYEKLQLNKIDFHFELNSIFYQIHSLLVNQRVSIPNSQTIDFHGFILCLQQISRTYHINLPILINTLISSSQ